MFFSHCIEPPRNHGDNEHHGCQQYCEPESLKRKGIVQDFRHFFNSNRLPHGGGKRARVLAGDNEVVEEGEDEVEQQASPDRDVVEHCPIWGVQSHLGYNYLKDY